MERRLSLSSVFCTFESQSLEEMESTLKCENLSNIITQIHKINPQVQCYLYFLLIPDWNNSSHFTSDSYLRNKSRKLQHLQKLVHPRLHIFNLLPDYRISWISQYIEKVYNQKNGLGSCIDLCKILATRHRSQSDHLILDSNTLIRDYQLFYCSTFGQSKLQFNACIYQYSYVSVHNKVIYVPANHSFSEMLYDRLEDFCTSKPHISGSIYSKVFVPLVADMGLAFKRKNPINQKTIFVANLWSPHFEIIRSVLVAVSQSWKNKKNILSVGLESRLMIGKTIVDEKIFVNLMRKYFTSFWQGEIDLSEDFLPQQQLFWEKSDLEKQFQIIFKYLSVVMTKEATKVQHLLKILSTY